MVSRFTRSICRATATATATTAVAAMAVVLVTWLVLISGMVATSDVAQAQTRFDRPGSDYARLNIRSGDPAECALRCERDRRCRAWSFSYPISRREGAVCALKNAVPDRIENTCCVSGIRGEGVVEPKTGPIEMSIDRAGGDYRHFDIKPDAGGESCMKACEDDKKCRAWTYTRPGYVSNNARCYLKSRITPPRRKPCCISGVVR